MKPIKMANSPSSARVDLPLALSIALFLFLFLAPTRSVVADQTPTLNFAAARTYRVGGLPKSIVIGDFNNDGIKDLAVANKGKVP